MTTTSPNSPYADRLTQVVAAIAKALAYLALFLGSQILVAVCFSVAVMFSVILETGTMDLLQATGLLFSYAAQMTLISNLFILAFLTIFFFARKKQVFQQIQLRPVPAPAAAGGAAVAPLLYAVVTLVLAFLPASWLADYEQAAAPLNGTGVLPFLSIALVAPVTEEVVFRGLIQSRLARALPGWPAVLLSSLLFALCHGQPVWMGYAFVLGLVLGMMAWHAGSILPGILLHLVFNTIGQILTLPPLAQADGLAVLLALLAIGAVLCLAARKGLAILFVPNTPSDRKEHDPHV